MKASHIGIRIFSITLILNATTLHASDFAVSGQVRNMATTPETEMGVSGVSVTIRNKKNNQKISEGATDDLGNYSIKVPEKSKYLVIYYEKLGFQNNPTVQDVNFPSGIQPVISMVQEGGSPEYYAKITKNLATTAIDERQEQLNILATLPKKDKETLTKILGGPSTVTLAQEFSVANKKHEMATTTAELLATQADLKDFSIHVDKRAFVLRGEVITNQTKAAVEKSAKAALAPEAVSNQLKVLHLDAEQIRAYNPGKEIQQ